MYGVPDLPLSGSTRDESTEVDHTMYNAFWQIKSQFTNYVGKSSHNLQTM